MGRAWRQLERQVRAPPKKGGGNTYRRYLSLFGLSKPEGREASLVGRDCPQPPPSARQGMLIA